MNYIWDNIDKHLTKEQMLDFFKFDGENLETSALLNKIKDNKLSYTSFNLIKKDSYILDIGCGLGIDCLELSFLTGEKGKVIGVDISDTLIKEATSISLKHKINNISYQTMDAHELEFKDETFDCVCIRRSLQHMVNPQKVINEILRVLSPNGIFIIIEPDRGSSIINHPDRQLTRMIMTYTEEVVRNPWIGRQLKQLLSKKDISSLSINFYVDTFPNLISINNTFGIEKAASQLVNLQILKQEQATNWINILKDLDKNNQIFCSTTQFIATGTKK